MLVLKNWLQSDGRFGSASNTMTFSRNHAFQVFQVLLLDGENTGRENGSLRDARNLVISDEQFEAFLERHKGQRCLVPEDNKTMKDSYLNLDEEMRRVMYTRLSCQHVMTKGGEYRRFLNCQDGGKKPGRSLLKVGVQAALEDAGFDNQTFVDRGGIFEWSRERKVQEELEW